MSEFVKCWMGNLDGKREGLVIANSQKKAAQIIGTSMCDFQRYWTLHLGIWPQVEPYKLYVRDYGRSEQPWRERK